jgi:hypothetical protein
MAVAPRLCTKFSTSPQQSWQAEDAAIVILCGSHYSLVILTSNTDNHARALLSELQLHTAMICIIQISGSLLPCCLSVNFRCEGRQPAG